MCRDIFCVVPRNDADLLHARLVTKLEFWTDFSHVAFRSEVCSPGES